MSRAYGLISFIGIFAILMLTGCGTRYIQDTKIEYTKEKAELAKIVRAYRDALRDKDIETLEKMTSDRYYENASTTTDATDDYGRNGLQKVFADLKIRSGKWRSLSSSRTSSSWATVLESM